MKKILAFACLLLAAASARAGLNQWTLAGDGTLPGGKNIAAVTVNPVVPTTLYVGAGEKVCYSSNNGTDWNCTTNDLTGAGWLCPNESATIANQVQSIAVDPITPSRVYAGTSGGVYFTENGGATWYWSVPAPALSGVDVTSTALTSVSAHVPPLTTAASPPVPLGAGPNTILDASASWGGNFTAGVVGPTGTGYAGYDAMDFTGGSLGSRSLRCARFASSTDLSGTISQGSISDSNDLSDGTVIGAAVTGGTIYANTLRSIPAILNPSVSAVTVSNTFPSLIFMGSSGGGVYWSDSEMHDTPLVPNTLGNPTAYVTAVKFSPTDKPKVANGIVQIGTGTVYAGSDGAGMWKSTDGGLTWGPAINSGLSGNALRINTIAIDASGGSETLYIGTSGAGVYKSSDAGATWSVLNGTGSNVLPTNGNQYANVKAIVMDPVQTNKLYVGTFGGGVYRSKDGGSNWLPLNTGLTDYQINSLDLANLSQQRLWVGTPSGLFQMDITDVPTVIVSPASLSFPVTAEGQTSTAQTVTLENNGFADLDFSWNLTGEYDFATTCESPLASGAKCTFTITFKPLVDSSEAWSADRTGLLTITSNDPGSPRTVSMQGTAAKGLVFSPGSLDFGEVTVGTETNAQRIVVTNTGTAALTVGGMAAETDLSSDYAVTNTCGSSLDASLSCSAYVSFKPSRTGNRSGNLLLALGGVVYRFPVAGTGTTTTASAGTPMASLVPATIDFGSVAVGGASDSVVVTLSNVGNADLQILNASWPADYVVSGDAGSCAPVWNNASDPSLWLVKAPSLVSPNDPNTFCSVTLTFKPRGSGDRSGSFLVYTNDPDSPHKVELAGIGVSSGGSSGAGNAQLSPASLSFPSTATGSASSPLTVSLKNAGSGSLKFGGATAGGDFRVESLSCKGAAIALPLAAAVNLAAGEECVVGVVFAPTGPGSRSGNLYLYTDDAAAAPAVVALAGAATGTKLRATRRAPAEVAAPAALVTGFFAADLALVPSSMSFPTTALGGTSAAQTVSLTNTQLASVNLQAAIADGDYTVSAIECAGRPVPVPLLTPVPLASGTRCLFSVVFTPMGAGERTGTLYVYTSESETEKKTELTGTSIDASGKLAVSPTSYDFGSWGIGSTSNPASLTVTNNGTSDLTITGIDSDSEVFTLTSLCGRISQPVVNPTSGEITGYRIYWPALVPGASCKIGVNFKPTDAGLAEGHVNIDSNNADGTVSVSLSGRGSEGSTGGMQLSPSSLDFGTLPAGGTSPAQVVVVTNVGADSVSVVRVYADSDFGVVGHSCYGALLPGGKCQISVVFTPSGNGDRTGTLHIVTDNAAASDVTVSLAGSGGPAGTVPFSIVKTVSGTTSSMSLAVTLYPAANDVGRFGGRYFGLSAFGNFYLWNGVAWTLYQGGTFVQMSSSLLAAEEPEAQLLSSANLYGMTGAQFWFGYGVGDTGSQAEADMIQGQKYWLLYTVP